MQVIQVMKQLGYTRLIAHHWSHFEVIHVIDLSVSINWVVESDINLDLLSSGSLWSTGANM